jgi:acetoin utilization deacetylase AcuC-like enzyme
MLKIAYAPIYKYELPEGHRFPMEKYALLPDQLRYEGLITDDNLFYPEVLSDHDFLLTHTTDYFHRLRDMTLTAKEVRKIGFPISPAFVERGKVIASGTYRCAIWAKEHQVSLNIAGGTHHSFADRGEAFCCFNDVAVASNVLLRNHEATKILVVDLDVHQGNGTAKIFENEPRVFTFSMHGEKNYPSKKEKSSLDIGLPDGADDQSYLTILSDTLPRLIIEFKPDMAFYVAGVDILATDKLGRLGLTKAGCKERDRYVFETLKSAKVPVAVSMGGGYSPELRDIIDAHANTFRMAADVYF